MKKTYVMIGMALAALGSAQAAQAGAREQALRIYNRVAGVPPSDVELRQMTQLISAGDYKGAARVATSSFHFYNTNLVRWAHELSNREETTRPKTGESQAVPLNDYVATIVGMVRDNEPFDQVLYGDLIYTAPAAPTLSNGTAATVAAFSFSSNTHYLNIGDQISPINGLDLSKGTTLVKQSQTALRPTIPADMVAGLLTTRQSGLEFFSAGTNRRPLRYALKGFLCVDPAEISDTTSSDRRVRRDVERAPGGNSQTYLTSCKGCHAGLDGLAGGLVNFDFSNGALTFDGTRVASKVNSIVNFPEGHRPTNASWVNEWVRGPNAKLGWPSGAESGTGANSLGRVLAGTHQFSVCMVKRAFKLACMREPGDADATDVQALALAFPKTGYNMKNLFEDAAILRQCRGN